MIMRVLFPALAVVCLHPVISPAAALLMGVVAALVFGNPYLDLTHKVTHKLLALSIVGLGAAMDFGVIAQVGLHGLGLTALSIAAILGIGIMLGKFLRAERDASILIAVGTAICGGSAIAAAAPVIHAKQENISVALGVVFLLNALALMLFPWIGHYFDLGQHQFGIWSALSIHDTSSVVGATSHYGSEALEVGTTVKLTRALWIIPVTFLLAMLVKKEGEDEPVKTKKPWFILGFVLVAAFFSWVPGVQDAGEIVGQVAKRVLVMTLFLIGASLTRDTLKAVGFKPLVQGIILWVLTSSLTLCLILAGVV